MWKRIFLTTVFLTTFFLNIPGLNAWESINTGDEENWRPAAGDTVWVDTEKNQGFLTHSDGSYFSFPVVTGQKRRVCYIGICYFAATPKSEWIVKAVDYKDDRYTFGNTGQFLRLFKVNPINGELEYSHYGLHSHKVIEEMLASDNQFRSYGCILIQQQVLDLIYQTYLMNSESLRVKTF